MADDDRHDDLGDAHAGGGDIPMEPTGPPPGPDTGTRTGPLTLDDLPDYTGPPVDAGPPSRSWSAGRIVALVTGLLVLAGGVAFAVTQASSGDGAGSPEEAVERMLDAVAAEDVLGAFEALDPAEREAIQPGVEAIVAQLERLGVLSDVDLEDVQGADFEFRDVELETETLAPDLAVVTPVGGTVLTTTDPEAFPLGESIPEEARGDLEPVTEEEPLADDDTMFATVERDGGWYVSIGYTIAEAARRDAGAPFPSPDEWIRPRGASSASGVADELAKAAEDFDARRLVELLAPGEMDPLHRYAPLFMSQFEAAAEQGRSSGVVIDVTDLEVSEEGEGGVVRLGIDRMAVTIQDPAGSETRFSFDGECSVTEMDHPAFGPQRQEFCLSDLLEQGGFFGLFSAPQGALKVLTVVEVDGEWYLSPVRTSLDVVVQFLEALDDDAIGSLMEMFGGSSSAAFSDSVEVEIPEDPEGWDEVGGEIQFGETSEAPVPPNPFDDPACQAAMEEYGRRSAEGATPEQLGPFPPAECDFGY